MENISLNVYERITIALMYCYYYLTFFLSLYRIVLLNQLVARELTIVILSVITTIVNFIIIFIIRQGAACSWSSKILQPSTIVGLIRYILN